MIPNCWSSVKHATRNKRKLSANLFMNMTIVVLLFPSSVLTCLNSSLILYKGRVFMSICDADLSIHRVITLNSSVTMSK